MMDSPEDIVSLAVLRVEVDLLRAEVKASTESTKALVEAWNATTGLVRFVKWMSTFMAAIGSLWLLFKYGFKGG